MTDKYRPEPTLEEAKKRIKEYGKKVRQQHPIPPTNEDEPLGTLTGDPEKFLKRLDEEDSDS